MAFAETAPLVATLDLKGNFAASLKRNQAALGSFGASIGRAGKGVGQLGAGFARIGAIAGTALVGGVVAATRVGMDFEAQLRTINTIARETPEGLNAIGDTIRKVARDTGTPLAELTQGYYDLLSAGIKAADAPKILTEANKLAIGALGSTAETVDLLTTAINVYGGDVSKAGQFTDEFAKAVERGKVKVAEIAASYAQVAPLAASLNVENKELAAGYARLTAAGTPAGEAATQMASALTALLKKTPDLEALEKQTRKNYAAIAGSKGLNVALQEMQDDAAKAGIELIDLVGRKEALLYILQTTGPNLKAYNADLAAMGDSAGTAAEQMGERTQGLSYQIDRVKANLQDAAIELSNGFLPALTRSADKLVTFLNTAGNREQLKAIGTRIGEAIDGIKWDAVLAGAKQFVSVMEGALSFAKLLYDAFSALPGPIKEASAGFLVLNKLSGGLLASGAGNIVGGLTSAIAKAGAAKLPVVGALFAQPVFVTNWPLGGLGGLGGGVGGGVAAAAGKGLLGIGGAAVGALAITAIAPVVLSQLALAIGGEQGLLRSAEGVRATARARGVPETAPIFQQRHGGLSPDDRAAVDTRSELIGIRHAVESQRPPTVNVTVNVTAAQVTKAVTIQRRYGPPGGSREGSRRQLD